MRRKPSMIKIFRTSTVPVSLNVLLKGQLKFLNQHFQVTAVSGPGEDLSEVQEREGVRIIPVEMQRQISPLKDLISLYRLFRLFRREKPQIVHSITPKAGLLSMLAAKMAGVPIRMHTFTGLIFPSRKGLLQQVLIWMDRLLCWAATDVYPEGQGVKNDLLHYKITSKPLKVIAKGNVNGIDCRYFSREHFPDEAICALRPALGISKDDFVFIFVGRLVNDKGINELVEAFSQLKTQNAKLLLIGTFEQELDPLLPETLKKIQGNKNIISVGFQKDVRPYFAASNALVFPSYREGFPNVVMQAGAMELPSIVSDINGCNEIIINEENGVIIPAKNVIILQQEMDRMAQEKRQYELLRSNSRPLIVDRYSQEFVWSELLKEYHQLLKAKNV